MSIATYGELKAAIADWLDRADMTERIPDFIRLAEKTLTKVLRDPKMVATTTLSLTSPWRHVATPTDFLEPAFVQIAGSGTSGGYPLERVTSERLVSLRRTMRQAGAARFYSVVGGALELAPSAGTDTSIELAYYAAIPALTADGEANWLLDAEPDLYLYTALLHAASFLHDTAMIATLSGLVSQQISAAVQSGDKATLDSLRTPGTPQ